MNVINQFKNHAYYDPIGKTPQNNFCMKEILPVFVLFMLLLCTAACIIQLIMRVSQSVIRYHIRFMFLMEESKIDTKVEVHVSLRLHVQCLILHFRVV